MIRTLGVFSLTSALLANAAEQQLRGSNDTQSGAQSKMDDTDLKKFSCHCLDGACDCTAAGAAMDLEENTAMKELTMKMGEMWRAGHARRHGCTCVGVACHCGHSSFLTGHGGHTPMMWNSVSTGWGGARCGSARHAGCTCARGVYRRGCHCGSAGVAGCRGVRFMVADGDLVEPSTTLDQEDGNPKEVALDEMPNVTALWQNWASDDHHQNWGLDHDSHWYHGDELNEVYDGKWGPHPFFLFSEGDNVASDNSSMNASQQEAHEALVQASATYDELETAKEMHELWVGYGRVWHHHHRRPHTGCSCYRGCHCSRWHYR